jgi:phosphoserine aminotransferase
VSDRIYNFSAGPAVLPEEVIKKTQPALWNLGGSGIGLMECSHRSAEFIAIAKEAEEGVRKLAGIPPEYAVLFLQGGASTQFTMVPMSFLAKDRTADYLVTGAWSQKAVKEAKLFGKVHTVASSEAENFTYIPSPETFKWSEAPAYAHFTSNNTIFGTQWRSEPVPPAGVPLVVDASSDIFSRPIDVTKYGLIYAGAQKNLGPSGVTLVIVRKDWVERANPGLPTMMQYKVHIENDSMYNTPPCVGVFVLNEVIKWIDAQGGLRGVEQMNQDKARPLYEFLDNSSFFRGTARPDSRSLMNVTFRGPSEDKESDFIKQATKKGFNGLKGHRSVGGMRASIYNAFPRKGVEDLVAFMKEFERANK